MGANIASVLQNGCAPLYITPAQLHGIHYDSPVASAQVKSCLLLAGLYADGETSVTEPSLSRNHTELMLREFGADIRSTYEIGSTKATASIRPCTDLYGQKITVPGDISSADLARELEKLGKEVHYLRSFDEIEKFILKNCKKNDLLITMGAGNVYSIGNDLIKN